MQEYFLKQDPAAIARCLAGLMIDMNRIMCMDSLGENEKQSLLMRMKLNRDQLLSFIKEEEHEHKSFRYCNIESKE